MTPQFLEKRVFEKNPSLSPGIRLLIGKVPLKGSTPLSPLKKRVSTKQGEANMTII